MGIREGFLFSKSQKNTPEEILEILRKNDNFDKSYSTIWSVCKAKTLKNFQYLNKNFSKDTIGIIIQFDTAEEQISQLINTLPREIVQDLEFNNISFMTEYEEFFEDQKFNDSNLKKNKNINEREEKKMKIKAEIREATSEKDTKLRGFANLTIGDIVIRDVVVKEFNGKNEGETYYGFSMPNSRNYEKQDGTKVFIPAVELKANKEEDTKKLVSEVRKIITQAMDYSETNEHGRKVCEGEIDFDYNKDHIKSYTNIVQSEKNPNLRAFATAYIGNIVKINDIAMSEHQNQEGENFTSINLPSKSYEKDGETKYQEKVFPIGEGMRKALVQSIEESYVAELEKEANTPSKEEETEEDLEP